MCIRDRDATVYWGSLDYVFRNNTEEPIKIVSSAKNGTLTISIYGKETRPANRTIKFRSVVLETYMQEMKFEEDLTLAPGAEKKIRSGMPGYKVELYKQIYVDGVLQNEVKINTSKYSAYNLSLIHISSCTPSRRMSLIRPDSFQRPNCPSLMYLATLSQVTPFRANSKSWMLPAPLVAKWLTCPSSISLII